jgi:ABC-2 type transport system ATP-binding protein
MIAPNEDAPALVGCDLRKTFRRDNGQAVAALDGVSLEACHGTLTALVGPDGAGKTTLIRLAAGLLVADEGDLSVLGVDVAADPQQVQSRIGYMPQKFGLYEDLSVRENLDLYADLHGVTAAQRRERYPRLLEMTALGPFQERLAGRLSGGMKQKLGLACTLVRSPELLLLDEPTVGVDPLSRRELWEIVLQLVGDQHLSVLLSTSYLDEAERCGQVVVLHQGKLLAQGRPADVNRLAAGRTFLAEPPPGQTARSLQAQLLDQPHVIDAVPEAGRVRFVSAGGSDQVTMWHGDKVSGAIIAPVPPRFEDGFMVLLRGAASARPSGEAARQGCPDGERRANGRLKPAETRRSSRPVTLSPDHPVTVPPPDVVHVRDLVRRFGTFTAVDHVSFEVRRGEVFGLLGPNGAGKTTTFRMLCGLLPATGGTLRVAGVDVRYARASARQRIGYVAQKFSLYGQLSVTENLEFFASAYGLRGGRKRERVGWALAEFELGALARLPSGQLPGGYKQRLAMAAALLHEPEILFLDEPTSGADPLARRDFWRRITVLGQQGVTVIVTTHFMEEAEYCDRVAILDLGHVLAEGTPAEIRRRAGGAAGRTPTMDDAFIAIVERARQAEPLHGTGPGGAA